MTGRYLYDQSYELHMPGSSCLDWLEHMISGKTCLEMDGFEKDM